MGLRDLRNEGLLYLGIGLEDWGIGVIEGYGIGGF